MMTKKHLAAIAMIGMASTPAIYYGSKVVDLELAQQAESEKNAPLLIKQFENKQWVEGVIASIGGGPWVIKKLAPPQKLPIFGYTDEGIVDIQNTVTGKTHSVLCRIEDQDIACYMRNPTEIHRSKL